MRRLLAGLVRLTGRSQSPWKRLSLPVPIGAFGPGSRREFAHYFEGESRVRVESIDEIVEWLLTCQYMTDAIQFKQRDLWQHPVTFEQLRCGDCEDFALWAWRKLADIGIDAEFYVGRVVVDDEPGVDRQHAWVVFRVDGVPFLFEPAARQTSDDSTAGRGDGRLRAVLCRGRPPSHVRVRWIRPRCRPWQERGAGSREPRRAGRASSGREARAL